MALTIEQLSSIGQYLTIYLGSFMLSAGLLGSCINLWLFTRHGFRKSPCSRYVVGSSVFDIIHLIVALLFRILADGFNIDPASLTVIGCRIRYYLITFSAYSSLGCRCLAVFDRYACSSRSIAFRQWSSFKMAYRFLIINTFIWACFALPNFLFFNLIPINPKRVVCYVSEPAYSIYFAYFVNPVLYFALPLIVFISLAIKTYRNLRLMNINRRIKRLEREMTSMVTLQAAANSISSLPYGIQFVYDVVTLKSTKDEYRLALEHLFLLITRLFYYINFISAFYIYYISSQHIRSTIRRHFRSIRTSNRKQNTFSLVRPKDQSSENSITKNNSNANSP